MWRAFSNGYLRGPWWIVALVAVFGLIDQIRGALAVNLGRFPMWFKELYVRVFIYEFDYIGSEEADETVWNRAQRRASFFGLPGRARLLYYGTRLWMAGKPFSMSGAATLLASRSGLFWEQRPGGLPVITDRTYLTGNILFVDVNGVVTGTTSGYGGHPDQTLTTIDGAINVIDGITGDPTNQGDTIFVLPGHTENLAAADGFDLDVAGVAVVGLGTGNNRPTLSATVAAGNVVLGAANCKISNIRLVCNFTGGGTSAINVEAAGDGCVIHKVDFRDTASTKEWLIHISIATTVTDLLIDGCRMIGLIGGDMTNSILFAGSHTNVEIKDCFIDVDSSDDVVDLLTTAGTGFHMHHCTVINEDAAVAGYCVRAEATTTGSVHDCRFGYNKIDAEISSGGGLFWFENYASNTIAQSGLLDPATTHAIP